MYGKAGACKKCPYSAICFGLGEQAVLQYIANHHMEEIRESIATRRLDYAVVVAKVFGRWLPSFCLIYLYGWFGVVSADYGLNIQRYVRTLK